MAWLGFGLHVQLNASSVDGKRVTVPDLIMRVPGCSLCLAHLWVEVNALLGCWGPSLGGGVGWCWLSFLSLPVYILQAYLIDSMAWIDIEPILHSSLFQLVNEFSWGYINLFSQYIVRGYISGVYQRVWMGTSIYISETNKPSSWDVPWNVWVCDRHSYYSFMLTKISRLKAEAWPEGIVMLECY